MGAGGGTVTLSGLGGVTSSTAQGYATTAQENVAIQMGYASYADMVSKASSSSFGTIIYNGFINTALLTAEAITAKVIASSIVTSTTVNAVNIDAASIKTGTISTARLDAAGIISNIIQANTITTGKLHVTGGSTLGAMTVNSDGSLSCGSAYSLSASGNLVCNSGIFGTGVKFGGELVGVRGSFTALNCGDSLIINSTLMSIQGMDVRHNGTLNNRSLRFRASNMWVRGSLGADRKNLAVVTGGIIKYYVNGDPDLDVNFNVIGDYVQGYLPTTSYKGNTYYIIPLYGDTASSGITSLSAHGNCVTDDINGFPVDLVIFNATSGSYKYSIMGNPGKEVVLVNAQNGFNNIYYASVEQTAHQMTGGVVHRIVNCRPFMSGSRNSNRIIDSGWMLEGWYDNDW